MANIRAYVNFGKRSKTIVVGYVESETWNMIEQSFDNALFAYICVIALKNRGILTSWEQLFKLESMAFDEDPNYWKDPTIYEAVHNPS